MALMTPTDLGLTVAFSVVVLVNLLGNGLVCLVVLRYRGMRGPINYLLVNLAVSDMMVAIFITPVYVIKWAFHHPSGIAGDYMCRFITGGNFIWVAGAASAFSLVVVAVERYFAVVHPLDERWRLTNRRLIAVIVASWLYGIIFNLPLFFVVGYNGDAKLTCPEHWPTKQLAKVYTIGCFFVFGAIPMGAMAFLYLRMLCNLWKSHDSGSLVSEQARIRSRLKVTKMVLVVSVMYAVCWLPNLVLYMLSQFKPELYEYGSVSYVASVVLVGVNSAMNPFIYALHSSNFRQYINGALCCRTYVVLKQDNGPYDANGSGPCSCLLCGGFNIMVALFITPVYVIKWAFHHPSGIAGDYMWQVHYWRNFIWVGGAASAFSLVAVAVERYFAVVHPLGERWRLTDRRLIVAIVASWLYGIIFNLPLFFVVRYDGDAKFTCPELWSSKQLNKVYTIGGFFVFGAIPMGAMAFIYLRMLSHLWKSHNNDSQSLWTGSNPI
ncbi:hypothetical protein OS493_003138 [Desmophyllum pertusum]|uniref:G-protein coupled receptors family 1 profile domain-containing protein n=1 Tax=Desmophyllum pertusum TaxID=174260 RepID=A0A9W9YGJ4_9CNID|nr:hypothetical protein OS493_003138 [Desmophyllum pertusum]